MPVPAAVPEKLTRALERAWEVRGGFPRVLAVDRPRDTVPVSVTGTACALNCAHCGGHYLKSMRGPGDVPVPGAPSYLVSGGCDGGGKVPLHRNLDLLARLRATGARLNLHTGLVAEEEARLLAPYGAVASLDWVVHAPTVREVTGLEAGPEDYLRTYRALARNLPVVPHICVGLRGGSIQGEWEAIEALVELGPAAVVFLVFMPTPGTRYENCAPPDPEAAAALLAYARTRLPGAEIALGCMRPKGAYRQRLDPLAVAAGVNRIVMPAPSARREAVARGLSLVETRECCALGTVAPPTPGTGTSGGPARPGRRGRVAG
ncbi:MAG: radical SAM protein [Bacillota bacterium]